jgi:hypothetical protein
LNIATCVFGPSGMQYFNFSKSNRVQKIRELWFAVLFIVMCCQKSSPNKPVNKVMHESGSHDWAVCVMMNHHACMIAEKQPCWEVIILSLKEIFLEEWILISRVPRSFLGFVFQFLFVYRKMVFFRNKKINSRKVKYFSIFGGIMESKLENTFQCLVILLKMSWKITY